MENFKKMKEEDLSFDEKRRYAYAYDVAKRTIKYIFSYLLDYKLETRSNVGRYSYENPIEIHVKIYWREQKAEIEAPLA